MKNKRIRNDIILIVTLLAAAFAAWGVIKLTEKPGAYAVVEIDGQEYARYPLNKDFKTDIKTDGGHINTLVISGGKAYFESADCPDKLCVKQGGVRFSGQTIICLPHKLIIRITGESGVDATT